MKSLRSYFHPKEVLDKGIPESQQSKEILLEDVAVENSQTKNENSDILSDSEDNVQPKKKMKVNDSYSIIESQDLLEFKSSVTEWPDLHHLDSSWKNILKTEFSKPYFHNLQQYIDSERRTSTIYPPINETFTAFQLCPYDQVRVVIIGQDPYHGPNQAHGLAFSVKSGVQCPPSLNNIFLEVQQDLGVGSAGKRFRHGNLEAWARQGVLLLNTCLTVRKGEANSHQKKGWEIFTDSVIRELGKKEGIVYLLWGNPASAKCAGIDRKKNLVITSSHPSPLGAYKTDKPFIGSKCFSRCNEGLVKFGKDPIDWTIN